MNFVWPQMSLSNLGKLPVLPSGYPDLAAAAAASVVAPEQLVTPTANSSSSTGNLPSVSSSGTTGATSAQVLLDEQLLHQQMTAVSSSAASQLHPNSSPLLFSAAAGHLFSSPTGHILSQNNNKSVLPSTLSRSASNPNPDGKTSQSAGETNPASSSNDLPSDPAQQTGDSSLTPGSTAANNPKRLHVSNIPFRFREADLRELLGPYGNVLDVEIIFNERGSKCSSTLP